MALLLMEQKFYLNHVRTRRFAGLAQTLKCSVFLIRRDQTFWAHRLRNTEYKVHDLTTLRTPCGRPAWTNAPPASKTIKRLPVTPRNPETTFVIVKSMDDSLLKKAN